VHQLNVDATRELLRLIDRHPTIRQFVVRSYAEVYSASSRQPDILDEDQPLNLDPRAPQWIRDRVEADLVVCTRMGLAPYRIAVLRCAECLAPECGSQLHDYLSSDLCLSPLGFDPMINLATITDIARALVTAARVGAQGVFNIPGADTLPLSEVIAAAGRREVLVPGPLLAPLYRWRQRALGADFHYGLNASRFHINAILDGRRAASVLKYTPTTPLDWTRLRASLSLERRAARQLWARTLGRLTRRADRRG
jgi:nucleoside-diphosphate-sugar epimerase